MPRKSSVKTADATLVETAVAAASTSNPTQDLADALRLAIETSRPSKITISNRKKNTPWTPKDGKAKLKLKRKLYQHGMMCLDERLTNEQIELANKLRPGTYLNHYVTVTRRRDKGIDVDYPIKTQMQAMRLATEFGITNFTQLLSRLVDEGQAPKKVEYDEDGYAI